MYCDFLVQNLDGSAKGHYMSKLHEVRSEQVTYDYLCSLFEDMFRFRSSAGAQILFENGKQLGANRETFWDFVNDLKRLGLEAMGQTVDA